MRDGEKGEGGRKRERARGREEEAHTKTGWRRAQGTALKEFGEAKQAAQEAEESAVDEISRRYVVGGRRRIASKQRLREAVGGAGVRARKKAPCLGSPRQGAVAERRRARFHYIHELACYGVCVP